jgi:nucleolar protein 6
MNLKQKEAATKRMGDKKRKREEDAGALGPNQQKPKRVKNKAKNLPKGNKARKRAAAQLMNGANAIPVQERIRNGPSTDEGAEEGAPAAAAPAEEGSKPAGEDFFVIDTTPMNPAEVAEKKKSKGQIKRERQVAKEAEHHTAEWLADKEVPKGKKRKEAHERNERNDKKKAQRGPEKKEKKHKKKEVNLQEESRKRKERKERKSKMDEDDKEKESETSSSESESDSDLDSSSSGSESEVKVKKTAPKAAEKKSEKKEKPAAKEAKQEEQATNKNRFIVFVGTYPIASSPSLSMQFDTNG